MLFPKASYHVQLKFSSFTLICVNLITHNLFEMVLGVVRHLNHAQGIRDFWRSRVCVAVGFIRSKAAASAEHTTSLLFDFVLSYVIIIA